LHVSALNADENGPSEYLRSRGRGELAIWEVFGSRAAAATIFRPSIVFGEDDRFLNLLSRLAAKSPIIPLGSPGAQFQPVWVGDVARAIVESLVLSETGGRTYPLVGPRVYTMRELLDFVIALNGQKRTVINLPHSLAMLQAAVFEFPPGKWLGDAMGFVLTRDNVRSMTLPNVSTEPFPALFGAPAALERIVPAYLHSGRAQYQSFRYGAGR
jgi:NADH dehydrogenase